MLERVALGLVVMVWALVCLAPEAVAELEKVWNHLDVQDGVAQVMVTSRHLVPLLSILPFALDGQSSYEQTVYTIKV